MFAKISSFWGCFNKQQKEKVFSDKMLKNINQAFEDFDNRPIFKVLTEQIIDSVSDENLLWLVMDNLQQKQPKDFKSLYQTVMLWNKSQQAIYMIWELETEVNNGGFDQFYFNSSGQFYQHLPDALRLICANKFADFVQEVNNTYERENEKIEEIWAGRCDEDSPLNDFSTRFYDLYKEEDLYQLQIDYIRKHKTDFIE